MAYAISFIRQRSSKLFLISTTKNALSSFFLIIICIQACCASVTLVGTRVIYPSNKQSVSLNFRSSDNVPSVIDLWVSKSAVSSSQSSDSPFVITPSVFRIDPNKGQSTKLIYTGGNLPNDRESVFYLNFVQLPASDKRANKLLVTYKSTVKIFYRPENLKQSIDDIDSYLSVDINKINSGVLTVYNDSEFYVTPTQLNIEKNGRTVLNVPDSQLNMLPPFSHQDIKIKPLTGPSGIEPKISIINDLGGVSTYKLSIK